MARLGKLERTTLLSDQMKKFICVVSLSIFRSDFCYFDDLPDGISARNLAVYVFKVADLKSFVRISKFQLLEFDFRQTQTKNIVRDEKLNATKSQ